MSDRNRMCAVCLGLVSAFVGCTFGTSPDEKPTRADIAVLGDAPAPLELVISTDFHEAVLNGEVVQVTNTADTLFIDLPFAKTVSLSDLGSILVELANHHEEPAQVELSVELDNGQDPYRQSATMSQGGQLRYVFVFLQRLY